MDVIDVAIWVRSTGDNLYWGHRWAELPIHVVAIVGLSKLIRRLAGHAIVDVLVDMRRLLLARMVYIVFLLWFWTAQLPYDWRWVAGWLVGWELAFIGALAASLTPWRRTAHRLAMVYSGACVLGLAGSFAALWWFGGA